MGKSDKDSVRLDLKVVGTEEKDSDSRPSDQRVGAEEKALSKELKRSELLRKEEDTAKLTRTRREREAKESLERREKEDTLIHDKKEETIGIRVP